MPHCVIINCTSPNIASTQRQRHISYHSFPHNPFVKEKWIAATGRKDWFPTKHSTICSIHFEDTCFIEGKKLRLLKKTAYPTIDILKFVDNDDENIDKEQPSSLSRKIKQEQNTIEPSTADDDDSITKNTPKEKRLLIKLRSAREVIKEKDKQIKRLREQNRRKEKKILRIMTVLTSLKKQMMKQTVNKKQIEYCNV